MFIIFMTRTAVARVRSSPEPELLDPELLDPELLDPELLDPEFLIQSCLTRSSIIRAAGTTVARTAIFCRGIAVILATFAVFGKSAMTRCQQQQEAKQQDMQSLVLFRVSKCDICVHQVLITCAMGTTTSLSAISGMTNFSILALIDKSLKTSIIHRLFVSELCMSFKSSVRSFFAHWRLF